MKRWLRVAVFCLLPAAAYSCFAFFAGCLLMPVLPVLESGGFGAEILENSGLLITALAGLGAALIFLFPLLREEGDESSLKSRGIICMTVLAVSAALFFNTLLNLIPFTKEAMAPLGRKEGSSLLLMAAAVCLAGPAGEEGAFRAFCFRHLRKELGFPGAALLSSLFFFFFHGNLVQGIYAFLLGLVLCWSMEIFGTVKAPLACHMAANASSLILAWTVGKQDLGTGTMVFLCLCSGCIMTVMMVCSTGKVRRNDNETTVNRNPML